jgi:hypothetical protein
VKVTLHIEGPNDSQTVPLGEELSIGRTELADLVLDDSGLSRKNTTFFIDDSEVFVTDEDSLNGTFLNGEKITGAPRMLRNGDEIKIGSGTRIKVSLDDAATAGRGDAESKMPAATPSRERTAEARDTKSVTAEPVVSIAKTSNTDPTQKLLIAAGILTCLILFSGIAGFIIVSQYEEKPANRGGKPTPQIQAGSVIPVRVIDPLGGENEDDLDDLIASWEVAEDEIKAENVADVSVSSADTSEAELNVTAAFLADKQRKALEDRPGEKGIRPAGLDVPKELFGDGVIKQKVKLGEMRASGYHQPLDFAELAEKRLSKQLIEMPMAKDSYYLDVGGSASDGPFQSFSFQEDTADIQPGTPKFQVMSQLAGNFSGQKYDLGNPSDRKQMRMRLLRMFNQRARPILLELADAYFKKFGRPLRVTSLTRSMDYQILLNKGNANSFKVRGEGSLPPHTSGCAFDLARKHMPAEEQNFVMQKLAEMERSNRLDALIEYGANACFHVFIYDDGKPPKM